MERAKKLSEIKGDRAFEAFASLIPPIANLAEDPEAYDLFMGAKHKTRMGKMLALFKLVNNHKPDFIEIEAVKRGVSAEDLSEEISLDDIFTACTELLNDSLFLCFFVLAHRDAKEETASTSAPDSTTDPET